VYHLLDQVFEILCDLSAHRKTLPTQHSKGVLAAVALLLALMAILATGAARHESVTFDEIAHIGAGVSYLQKFDLRMNSEHPPLAKVLAALPLVLRGVHADYSHTSWIFSGKMFNEYLGEWVFGHYLIMRWNDPYSAVMWARMPMLLITLLLGLVIYIYGSRLGGAGGGLLCLCAYATMPAFLAFGPLVVTDVAVALFWILAVWHFPDMWRSPSRGAVIKLGLILASAFLTKFSSGLFFFVFIWNEPTDSFSVIPHFPASLILRRLLMPVWKYLGGLALFALSAGSRPTFILGHAYSHGVWFYFPVLFVLKSPLAFLLLLLLVAVTAIVWKRRSRGKPSAIPSGMEMRWRALWVSLAVFVVACMLNRLDISIRHFTIALALLILLLAPLPKILQSLRQSNWNWARAFQWVTVGLAVASLATALWTYPNYFPFLNVLSTGHPGYLMVNDSNLDWNQALPAVETFVQQRGLNRVLLDEYGFSDPAAYLPQASIWSCQQPSPEDGGQWVIISAGNIADGSNCLWLMKYPHEALAGGSMYAIHLPQTIPAAGAPDGPPLPEAYRYFGGSTLLDLRPIFTNCIRDPEQLQPTLDHMQALFEEQRRKEKEKK
jgi:hypothetical protein